MLKKNENIDYKKALAEVVIKTFIRNEGEQMIDSAVNDRQTSELLIDIIETENSEPLLNRFYQSFMDVTSSKMDELLDKITGMIFTHRDFSEYRKNMGITDEYIREEINMEGIKIQSYNFLMKYANFAFFQRLDNMGLDFDIEEMLATEETDRFSSDFGEDYA